MKTIATTLLAALAVSASSATLKWGSGTSSITFDGTKLSDASAYLVYLGSSGDLSKLYSFADGAIAGATTAQEASITTKPATLVGRFSGTYSDPTATALDVGTQVADGQYFGAYVTYTDGSGIQWFNFSSTAFKISGIGDDNTNEASATFAFNWSSKTDTVAAASDISAGGGWYAAAVPEPSVALMGLLGIGMLIKRRRA